MQLRLPGPTDGLLVILKLPGETCNINCHYCYEKRKPYDGHRVLSPEILRRFLHLCGRRPLRVVLHGGEPLIIGRRRMSTLLEVLRGYEGALQLALQTNGTLLDDEWLDFWECSWPSIEISISLDGDPDANRHRVDYRERPTHKLVAAALQRMAERGRPVGVIAVVTRIALGRAHAIVDHMRGFSAVRALKLSQCLDINVVSKTYRTANQGALAVLNPTGLGIPGWGTTPDEYAEFLIEAWHAWRSTGAYRQFLLEPFNSIVRALDGRSVGFSHFSDRKEPFILTLYPDGRIGSSDEFLMPMSLLGHIDTATSIEPLLAMDTNPELRERMRQLLSVCATCTHEASCRGGSLADRVRYAAADLDEDYCAYRRRLIYHVASAAAGLG
jgi:uncharacterized protein